MLTEICQYLHNWFDRDQSKYYGNFIISDGDISFADGDMVLLEGQYFRIVGSLLNDGVYQYPATELKDEQYKGAVWSMAVPPDFISMADEIAAWQNKYGSVDSVSMSPYNSESFGGYSYSKSGGGSSDGGDSGAGTWQGAFANRLSPWRKLI